MEDLAEMRRQAPTECAKQNAKSGMVSVYGKLYENPDRRCTAQIRTDPWNFYKRVAKKECKSWDVLDHDEFLGMFQTPQKDIVYDTPRAVAWAILDLAKLRRDSTTNVSKKPGRAAGCCTPTRTR